MNNIQKIGRYAYYGIVVLLIAIAFYQIYRGDSTSGSNFGVWQGVIYGVIATVAAIALAVIGLLTNPKSLIGFSIGVAVLAILYFIGMGMAPDEVSLKMVEKYGVELPTFQASHAGVWASIAMLALTVILAIAGGVKSIFDR